MNRYILAVRNSISCSPHRQRCRQMDQVRDSRPVIDNIILACYDRILHCNGWLNTANAKLTAVSSAPSGMCRGIVLLVVWVSCGVSQAIDV
jgi:hypothetical protein